MKSAYDNIITDDPIQHLCTLTGATMVAAESDLALFEREKFTHHKFTG